MLELAILECFYYITGTNAAGADLDTSNRAIFERLDFLKVCMPCPGCSIVGVTDIIPEGGTFSAYFTFFRHSIILQRLLKLLLLPDVTGVCK